MTQNTIRSIIQIIRACDSLQLCTCGDEYPETRHVTNAMNRDADNLDLYFMTGRGTPKYAQLQNNPKCCLYYFDAASRHAVRLFGRMEFVVDIDVRRARWRDEYAAFGYGGPVDADFVLMRFMPAQYKFYAGPHMHVGDIN